MASPASSKASSKSLAPTDSNPEIRRNRHGILFKRPGRRLASDFALEEQSTSLPSSTTFSLDYTELRAQRGRSHAVYPRDSMKFVPNSRPLSSMVKKWNVLRVFFGFIRRGSVFTYPVHRSSGLRLAANARGGEGRIDVESTYARREGKGIKEDCRME
ncbi:hypothetical protein N7490_009419 [Penicillium lividum]|nr:hypothetical protein N7490_009419 [Penicillium lividum]